MAAGSTFDTHLLPIERLLYRSDFAVVGLWRCPTDAPWFRNSGPMRNHCIVFPRTAVRIRRSRGETLFADSTIVMLYNRGDEYTREPISPAGDECDWFAVRPELVTEALGACADSQRPADGPFGLTSVRASERACLVQRRLVCRLEAGCEPLEADETILRLLQLLFPHTPEANGPIGERHLRHHALAAHDLFVKLISLKR